MSEIIRHFQSAGLTAMAEILAGVGDSVIRRVAARDFLSQLSRQAGPNQRLYKTALGLLTA